MFSKSKISCVAMLIAFQLFVSGGVSVASSFPFRSISIGDSMPKVVVHDYKSQSELDLDSLKGTVYIAVFWGADLPTKKKRTIQALKSLKGLNDFFNSKEVKVFSVNVLGDLPETFEEIKTSSDTDYSMYTDQNQKIYGDLGIFVMPAILLVDKEGNVTSGMGYSHDLIDRLKGEVEILLGEKTREQVEHELRPEVIEKSAEEKAAIRHLNMGYVMKKRGMTDTAIREFQEALKVYPKVGEEAYIELGCLYFDNGEVDEAFKYLEKGLELNPDSLNGQLCMAKVTVHDGDLEGAISDLQSIMLRNSRSHELHYVLGSFYEKQGKINEALKEYRKAYELLEHKEKMK